MASAVPAKDPRLLPLADAAPPARGARGFAAWLPPAGIQADPGLETAAGSSHTCAGLAGCAVPLAQTGMGARACPSSQSQAGAVARGTVAGGAQLWSLLWGVTQLWVPDSGLRALGMSLHLAVPHFPFLGLSSLARA